MSEKLSERMNRDGGHSTVYVPEVAALEQQLAAEQADHDQMVDIVIYLRQLLAAKDAEIARLRSAMVECGIPLEVIAGELNVGNMLEISTEVAQQIHRAVGMVRAALAETPAAPEVK